MLMSFVHPTTRLAYGGLITAAITLFGPSELAAASDLTVEIAGELLERGGAVTIYHIPVDADKLQMGESGVVASMIRIDQRYTEIQLRYPKDGSFAYRFRPGTGSPNAAQHWTQVLSIIGTTMEGQGPLMEHGFVGSSSSGGRIIRIPSMSEIAGPSEATRTAARWGETEGLGAHPPGDERSVRALVGLLDGARLQCNGGEQVQVCAPDQAQWPEIEAKWWRSIAEARLDRLREHALRRCYDSKWFENVKCDADPESDEPKYKARW
ncbi:hypothetical protein E2F50_05450 [Rhizobium deserti]|uniref:Uncharacterized protein n=1 Tax=Rhizobium deserti TaxID=2547961 RepID=A0A4R5UNP0_9HYPH|nr:hypothetical protein [Rhizobium deserti]TDK39557.1 hypothetical protein E2F50_05450 [Rhizobium deserti]